MEEANAVTVAAVMPTYFGGRLLPVQVRYYRRRQRRDAAEQHANSLAKKCRFIENHETRPRNLLP